MAWQDHFTREDLIARIRRLAEDHDLSQNQVAEVIGCGLTGNMIRGLANRARPKIVFGRARAEARRQSGGIMKRPLTGRPHDLDEKSRVKLAVAVAPPRTGRLGFVILDEIDDFERSTSVHFNDLRSAGGLQSGAPPRITDERCRYPLWPDRMGTQYRAESFEWLFCGKPVVPGESWCPECRAKVFTTVAPKPRPKRDRNGRRAGWEYGF